MNSRDAALPWAMIAKLFEPSEPDSIEVKRDRFDICLTRARSLVGAYRRMAPAGCDPVATWATIAVGGVTLGVTFEAAKRKAAAEKKAAAERAKLGGGIGSEEVGSKPRAALYEPIDFSREQFEAISQNFGNLGAIGDLTRGSNDLLTSDAMARARKLIPGFGRSMKLQGANARSLLGGQLPYEDVLDIVANRSEFANATGIAGTGGNATLRDLGLSRLDAIKTGGGILKDMVGMAEQISPINRYSKPSDFFVSPTERIQMAMQQNQLRQQSEQSANNLEAGADPVAQAQLMFQLGSPLPQNNSPDYSAMILGALNTGASAYGKYQAGNAAPAVGAGYDVTTDPMLYRAPGADYYSTRGGYAGELPNLLSDRRYSIRA